MEIYERNSNESARDYAYNIIKENIVNLTLKPGETISDIKISELLGISRTPIREAINKLKDESNIIDVYPQRGMRVSLIDTKIVNETKFLRLALEKEIIKVVCKVAKEDDILKLKQIYSMQVFCYENEIFKDASKLDSNLHGLLYKIADMEKLHKMIKPAFIHYDRVRNLEVSKEHLKNTIEDHRRLIEAIENKNIDEAVEIMDSHLGRWEVNEKKLRAKYPEYFME